MSAYDLGAARRRRGYAPKELIVTDADGSVEFKAPVAAEMPAETLDQGVEGKIAAAVRALFVNPADADEFVARYKPSVNDLADMLEHLYEAPELGEALASGEPSMSDGTP